MKRLLTALLCLLLTLTMVLSLAGCEDESENRRKSRRDNDKKTTAKKDENDEGTYDSSDRETLGTSGSKNEESSDIALPGARPDISQPSTDSGSQATPDISLPSTDSGSQTTPDISLPSTDSGNHGSIDSDENVVVEDEFIFRKLGDGTWEVCGIQNCVTQNIALPATYQGIPVTKTSVSAFQCQDEFLSVTIPGSIKIVDTSSFQGCENLTTLVFEEGVERLGASTFQSCRVLQTIVIPRSMVDLGSSSFQGCEALHSVFYAGSEAEWQSNFGEAHTYFDYSGHTTIYFYSESAPSSSGKYWHYVGGVPTAW